MHLIYLKEDRHYAIDQLVSYVNDAVATSPDAPPPAADGGGTPSLPVSAKASKKNRLEGSPNIEVEFFTRLKESMNEDFDSTVVRLDKSKQEISFRYVGLYDYFDRKSGLNLTFFFIPKFVDFKANWDDANDDQADAPTGDRTLIEGCDDFNTYRDTLLRAIDRYNREQNQLANQDDIEPEKRTSVLELAIRVLRDYLENGLYLVQRRELERNGQGEIDWNTTIDTFQPMIKKGRPYYMEVLTEQAYSEENHYVTSLQKCLVTTWGRKLEELGLSSVLQVNVPMLSEEELDHFGTPEYQIAQIDRELNVQFVTQSRRTLTLMKELIQRAAENKALDYESLSFGMTGAHALWERACAEVLGSELDKKISECGLTWKSGGTFRDYLPKPCWKKGKTKGEICKPESEKSGWRLDFIRTGLTNGTVEKLVILDAKYYCVSWKDGKIFGQPGMADITKQIFYQMTFKNLLAENEKDNARIMMLNAFLFPETSDSNANDPVCDESVQLQIGSQQAEAFKGIPLFAVRVPGMRLLENYANYNVSNDWFEKITTQLTTRMKEHG